MVPLRVRRRDPLDLLLRGPRARREAGASRIAAVAASCCTVTQLTGAAAMGRTGDVSVAVWIGMIALAGLDAETGVVMLLYLTLAHRARRAEGRLRTPDDLREAIVGGAAHRIRPELMTVLTMMIGLVPVMWSSGTGADVMKRIAAPMIGGLVTSFVLELLVYPAVFAIWKGRLAGGGESDSSQRCA